ncbi:CCA tRNA nucleotidyltransferase [Sandarakinorhabdus sp. DWP1-3-1]|uniref:CCA tRNA nucleotidyltransferase n=1 Tax=Sandarakinorhabdus sp. DWP1-3-1 TaxID=2804627 RepID=UPI003CF5160C
MTAGWHETPGGAALLDALAARQGDTRAVGGMVRDGLLGLPIRDIDLATRFPPAEVIRRLTAAGLKAIPTGIAHGTITAVAPDLVAEVTTLRRDVTTDGRHATVAFTDDWQQDASRRDFTINALYAALPDGPITDFFGGIDDLRARRVRFIGDPLQRIAEDHLRILRFFRFSARFAGVVDAHGLAACTARANDLMALSRERVANELRGLLGAADPCPTVALMLDHGIWAPIVPEIAAGRVPILARTVAAEATSGIGGDWRRRLAALLPPDPAIADAVAARLRLSNADKQRMRLAAVPLGEGALLAAAWRDGAPAIIDRLLIAGEGGPDVAMLRDWQRPRLPVGGRDLLARGLAPGPGVAARLADFERSWVAAGFPDDPATVTALLDRAVAAA